MCPCFFVTSSIVLPGAEIPLWIIRIKAASLECHQGGKLEGDPGSQGLFGANLAAVPILYCKVPGF